MSDNKTTLANHNARLDALVDAVNALPDAGGGEVVEPVEPVVQPLSVTKNGTYTPPEGVDGYAPVNVNVPSSGGDTETCTVTVTYEYYKSFSSNKVYRPALQTIVYDKGNSDAEGLEFEDITTDTLPPNGSFTITVKKGGLICVYIEDYVTFPECTGRVGLWGGMGANAYLFANGDGAIHIGLV